MINTTFLIFICSFCWLLCNYFSLVLIFPSSLTLSHSLFKAFFALFCSNPSEFEFYYCCYIYFVKVKFSISYIRLFFVSKLLLLFFLKTTAKIFWRHIFQILIFIKLLCYYYNIFYIELLLEFSGYIFFNFFCLFNISSSSKFESSFWFFKK